MSSSKPRRSVAPEPTNDDPAVPGDADMDAVRGGSSRRVELDHAGAYNFGVDEESESIP